MTYYSKQENRNISNKQYKFNIKIILQLETAQNCYTFYIQGQPENTFQAVLAMDNYNRKSFVMFRYHELQWSGDILNSAGVKVSIYFDLNIVVIHFCTSITMLYVIIYTDLIETPIINFAASLGRNNRPLTWILWYGGHV